MTALRLNSAVSLCTAGHDRGHTAAPVSQLHSRTSFQTPSRPQAEASASERAHNVVRQCHPRTVHDYPALELGPSGRQLPLANMLRLLHKNSVTALQRSFGSWATVKPTEISGKNVAQAYNLGTCHLVLHHQSRSVYGLSNIPHLKSLPELVSIPDGCGRAGVPVFPRSRLSEP